MKKSPYCSENMLKTALLRKVGRRIAKEKAKPDPLEKSLREAWRHRYSEDGEFLVEYGIVTFDSPTEDEIEDYICNYVVRKNYSQYDCTGKFRTLLVDYKICKAGVSIIHWMGRDI